MSLLYYFALANNGNSGLNQGTYETAINNFMQIGIFLKVWPYGMVWGRKLGKPLTPVLEHVR